MNLTVPGLHTPRVLIIAPGPRIAEIVHPLTAQGALVTVRPVTGADGQTRATLADLAGRHLVTIDPDADPSAFDVVLRDPYRDTLPTARPEQPEEGGRVTLVGGGPGDPGLLTVAGLEAIRQADVLVCDRLAPLSALTQARPDAEVVHVGKIPRGAFTPQEAINELLVDRALAGLRVVRFKGGDNFVFGRGGEEWNACVAHGIPVDVIPGVSSAVAVPALAGIPVTHRGLTQGFVVVSGHVGPGDERSDTNWGVLARCGMTLVILMGAAALADITAELLRHGLDPTTPAACIADGSMPSQRQVVSTAADIARVATESGLHPPVVTVIGAVVTALKEHQ